MSKEASTGKAQSLFVAIVFPLVLIISVGVYMFVLGDPGNFENGDPIKGHPIAENPGRLYGTIYKGGFIVPILLSVNLIIIIFSVERFITLNRAKGKGRIESFLGKVRAELANDHVDAAITACDEQQGSVANVMRSGLEKYKTVLYDATHDKESRLQSVKQELEEATALELPMLSKNLVILSTCASISTLLGLIGTVLGMIRAFSALATAGTPDASALSTGISEALINTAFGITGSCIAIIMFNFFSTKIDAITHGIDEAGFSVSQTLANHK
ncbi:MAG: MotA/TolQ/ExbB proton channel family protein [Flavobacteriales bacterium]|jgi:biopolymer transport protein ExbB|nr:MotA/TolQ/ExbB proton channel family protein [Flavobacteriales bacterium]MBK7083881.1 MotA/TolQ/ExbB proton channel family protein [Flavobacteriales bacterium]MBK7269659.1 MotA/TolQ/ExbB proton channel family protein [Flavobacteriales bacterium]MBK8339385.1 MotA/TolQ/ExbB proton channel family protein [Flavobacteriales bacterium]MBK9076851.1 MotA/TolQ/ExbB proton channel family protein [Flavobacteriales bacterium]